MSASPTAPDPRDELLAALTRSQVAAFRFTVKGNGPDGESIQATGGVDPKTRQYESIVHVTGGKSPGSAQNIVLGADRYYRLLGDQTWVHMDLNRMKKSILMPFNMSDPTGLVTWSQKVGEVHRTGAHTYSGKFAVGGETDPSVPIGWPSIWVFSIFGLADFMATTDGHGWVTSITIKFKPSDGKAVRLTTTMSGFGTKLNLKAPPKAQVKEIDYALYG